MSYETYIDEQERYNDLKEQVSALGFDALDILDGEGVDFNVQNPETGLLEFGYSNANTCLENWLSAHSSDDGTVDTDTPANDDGTVDTDTPANDASDGVDDASTRLSDNLAKIIDTSYNGNQIHYDPVGVDETVTKIVNYFRDLFEIVSDYIETDKPLDERGKPYRSAGPRPEALSFYCANLETALNTAKAHAVESISDIVKAVRAYSDGDASLLTKLLSGGGGGGGDPSSAPTFDGDDDLLGDLDNLDDEIIDEPPLENQEPSIDEDEKLVIPGVSGGLSQKNSTSTDTSLSGVTDETLKLDGSSDIASSLDNVGTSFFGTDGKFFVPSVSATSIEKDKVNSAGVVGAGAVLAAASLAVGGKIYHDKKNEAENSDGIAEADDELIDNAEDSDEKDNKKEDEKDNTDDEKNNKSIFKSSGVKFKESILDVGGDL